VAGIYQHALPVGSRIGSYQVRGVLGIGGFGITYKAFDNTLHRLVAIKEYLPSGLAVRALDGTTVVPKSEGDATDYHYGLGRFLDEARTLARFHEPSIVRVIAYMEAHGTAYFVMDYEEGECLDARLKTDMTLVQDEILAIVLPILRGLRSVHAQSFLHRDIKPLNIYLRRRDATPVLLDFGAARQALGDHSRAMTRMVTPGYAPFEQYLAEGRQGAWSDIYALGATMFHCATGVAPVAATERVAVAHERREDPVRVIAATLRRRYGAAFVDPMLWMLEPMPADRPQSVEAVLAEFAPGESRRGARRDPRAGDTVEDTLPLTMSEALDVDLGGPAPAPWPAETLQAVELNLGHHIGPLAGALVRKAAAQTRNVEELTELLARFIDSGPARSAFVSSTRALTSGELPPVAGSGAKLDPALLAKAEERLTARIGPVARVLVRKASVRAKTAEEFCRMLSEELREPAEREAFVRALLLH
jgi:serine/threonine protein kinase